MPFGSLALPGVVSAVVVWFLSSLVHMVLKYHKADYKKFADEDAVTEGLRKAGATPGLYLLPCANPAQMKDPAVRKRFVDGPVGQFAIVPSGAPNMAKYLTQWFLYCVLSSFFTAYVARHTLTFGTPGMQVMKITGAVAFVAYGFGYLQDSIWRGIPWSNAIRGLIDAVIFAAATAFTFHLLWPAA